MTQNTPGTPASKPSESGVPAKLPDRMVLAEMSPAFQERWGVAQAVAASRMFKGIDMPQKALTLMLLAESEGIHFMQAFMRYHIIDGQPTKKTDTILAEFQANKGRVKWTERSKTRAAAMFYSSLTGDEGLEVEFTMDDAKSYGLAGKDNWRKDPANMLTKRCITRAMRLVMPGIMVGMMSTEEALDLLPAGSTGDEEPTDRGNTDLSATRAVIRQPAPAITQTEPPKTEVQQALEPVEPLRKAKMSSDFLSTFITKVCDIVQTPDVDEALAKTQPVIDKLKAAKKLPPNVADYLDLLDDMGDMVLAEMMPPQPKPAPAAKGGLFTEED